MDRVIKTMIGVDNCLAGTDSPKKKEEKIVKRSNG